MIALQYIGGALVSAFAVWGLYSGYMFIKLSIAVGSDPYKKQLLQQIISSKSMRKVDLAGGIPVTGVGRVPTESELKEAHREFEDQQRRHHRLHAAEALLFGAAHGTTQPIGKTVTQALQLAEELEKQNAERPLPENPHGKEDTSHHA